MIPLMSNEKAVVSGLGVVNSVALNVAEYRDGIASKVSGLRVASGMDTQGLINDKFCQATNFDHAAFGEKDGRSKMDRSSAMVLKAWREAWKMSGLQDRLQGSARAGVFLGTTLGGSNNGLEYYANGERDISILSDYSLHAPGYQICAEAGYLGPNYVFSSACTSSNLAIAAGLNAIRANQLDVAVVGGFDVLSQVSCAGFSVMRNVSPDLCKPFDTNRNGLVLGEGAALLILESCAHFEQRQGNCLGYVCGSALTSDAFHMTAPDSNGLGATRCITQAIEDAHIQPDEIDCVFGHGTGTSLNDKSEAMAIGNVLGERASEIPTCSLKSAIGHTLGAAGAMNAVCSYLSAEIKTMPATLNFESKAPDMAIQLSSDTVPLSGKHCLSNTFGFGGSNCSVVLGFA